MIDDVMKDYFEEMPDISAERMQGIRKVMEHYNTEYLSDCTDDEMHYAYLCAFLYRLDRVSDEQLQDIDAAMMNENVQFYMEMDEDEKRLDAKPFRRNAEQLKKARAIRAEALRIAADKFNGCLKPKDLYHAGKYREEIPVIQSNLLSMSFSARRDAESLLSSALLDLCYVLEDTKQYSPELYNLCIRTNLNSE